MNPKKPEFLRSSRRYRPNEKRVPPVHSKMMKFWDAKDLDELHSRMEAIGYSVPMDRLRTWKVGCWNLIFKWLRNVEGLEPEHPPRRPPVFIRKYNKGV